MLGLGGGELGDAHSNGHEVGRGGSGASGGHGEPIHALTYAELRESVQRALAPAPQDDNSNEPLHGRVPVGSEGRRNTVSNGASSLQRRAKRSPARRRFTVARPSFAATTMTPRARRKGAATTTTTTTAATPSSGNGFHKATMRHSATGNAARRGSVTVRRRDGT